MNGERLTLSANAAPGRGGQGQNLAQMLEALGDRFTVELFCKTLPVGWSGHSVLAPSSARLIHGTPLLRRRRDWATRLEDTHFDRAVASRMNTADLFHGATGQCLLCLDRARALGARTVVDSVTWHAEAFGAILDRSCKEWGIRPSVDRPLRDRMVREYDRADVIRVMSDTSARTFLERGFAPERLAVVPPWIPKVDTEPRAHDSRPLTIGFVGLLEPWKGFHFLIEAFGALGLPDARLELWGGPGSRPVSRYLSQAARRWRGISVMPGSVQTAGIARVYGGMDILVHPTLTDGFGLVVAEAMSSGTPVICSTAAGAAELIEDGVNGFLVPPGNRDAIADHLRVMARDPDLRWRLGSEARRSAARLTLAATREAYMPRLEALLGQRQPAS